MVFKRSFTLLVATATAPFFAFVSIIFEQDCSNLFVEKKLGRRNVGSVDRALDIYNEFYNKSFVSWGFQC